MQHLISRMASGDSCHTFNPSHRQARTQSNQASVYASKYNWLSFQRCRASEVDSVDKQAVQEISKLEKNKSEHFKNNISSYKWQLLSNDLHWSGGWGMGSDTTTTPKLPVLSWCTGCHYFITFPFIRPSSEDPTYTFRGKRSDHLGLAWKYFLHVCLMSSYLMVMSWGLQHLCKVMSVLAYYKDQTVLADKRRKKKKILIWFCTERANSNESVAKLLNTFNKARIPNGTSNFHSQWNVTWVCKLQV